MKYISKNSGVAGQLMIIVEFNGNRFCRTSYTDNASVKWERWCIFGNNDALWLTLSDPGRLENSFWECTNSLIPEPTPAPPKTVKVRVGVVVNQQGEWAAYGGDDYTDEQVCTRLACAEPTQFCWLTAELAIPQADELPATVSSS